MGEPDMREVPPEKFWTVAQASKAFDVSEYCIRRLIKRGEIPHYRVGDKIRLDPKEVREVLYRKKFHVEQSA